ncbi:MAG: menaquinone biosynthesis protein [Acidobacteria bacterium]|nr:menaquinone biosynthesis protein [Acidobacteriota bacterium]
MTTIHTPRVSVVQYLNTVPLVWGMLKGEQKGKYDLDFTVPAVCADALRRREVDIGIIPSIEYQRIEHLQILSGLSIASKGKVKSVLLFSKVPVKEIRSIAIDNSSRTSVALLTILMRKFYEHPVDFLPSAPKPEAMLNAADAALVIGDPALAYDGPVSEIYDLAAEWRKFTGLPFVFAVWAGHEDANIARFRKDFEASRDYGLSHIDEIAREYSTRLNMQAEDVKVYLTQNIDYSLDEENRRGLQLFYSLASELGIISGQRDIYFA